MTTLDPITFGVLRHKLDAIIDEAYYTIGQVSGNPVVYEAGDHQEAICTPAGELAVFGGGVLHWTRSLSYGIRHVIANYADNPGFAEDDQFLLSDPYIGPIHYNDVQLLAPVFFEGEIIAWTGCGSHQSDVGGIDRGSVCVNARNLYEEGFSAPGLKLVDRGVIRRDIEDFFRNAVRAPEFGLLDIRAKIAANNVVKRRLVEMVERYGKDTVTALFAQLIRYSDERVAAKLAMIPDGSWTTVNYVEGRREPHLKVQITATKQGGRITLDFTGTSLQTAGSENMAVAGTMSSAAAPFISMVCYDIPWNEGLFRRLDFVLPEGTIVNPVRPAAVSAGVPSGANILTMTAALNVFSKMISCSDALREEACGGVTGSFFVYNLSGQRDDGRYFTTIEMDHFAGGTGGWRGHDGTGAAQNTWSVKTMIANVETTEMLFPLMYLWRRVTPDSGGPGKYRGGNGLENAMVGWGTEHIDIVTISVGSDPRPCLGFAGGLPASHTPAGIMRRAGIKKALADGTALPTKFDELAGEWDPLDPKGTTEMDGDDVIYGFVSAGGGGFGDSLDRDPDAVEADVRDGYVSAAAAHTVYGVVLADAGGVDVEATTARREAIRQDRLVRSANHAIA